MKHGGGTYPRSRNDRTRDKLTGWNLGEQTILQRN